MQNANGYAGNAACSEVQNGVANQELGAVLSSSLPSFYRSAYRLLGNAADAEDAVQDALLAAHKHLHQFKGESQMSTWLTAIVQNSARMKLRTRLRHIHVSLDEPVGEDPESSLANRLPDGGPNPEEECRDSELSRYLGRFRGQLSPILLRTFQLRDVEGLSTRETAEILGIPSGTVKAQLGRARKKLRELMQRALAPRSRDFTNARGRNFVA
jgi:RNA polymerase sigma-70 factor (ECF subfamily)